MERHEKYLKNRFGTALAGASVQITNATTGAAAALYSDNGVTALASNTLTTDPNGKYSFYAANGRYTRTTTAANYVADTDADSILLFDPWTDGGSGGFWPDITSTAKVLRLRDRVFVGGGAAFTGNFTGTQSSFVATATDGANWAPRDSALFVASDKGLMQITGFVSNANIDTAGSQPTESIAVSGFAILSKAARSGRALYGDVQFEAGDYGYGLELAIKNKGSNLTSTPYSAVAGTFGIQLGAGGDSTYGGSPTNPCNTGLLFVKGASTWNKGIVFLKDSLTGDDGATGTATAIELGKGHIIAWREPANNAGFSLRSDVSAASSSSAMVVGNNVINIFGDNNVQMLQLSHNASAVNYFGAQNRATGLPPLLQAKGSDTDVDAAIQGQGAGGVRLRDGAAAVKFQCNTTGVGFFAATPVAKPTLAVASSDLATVITLANDIRTRLINYGLAA